MLPIGLISARLVELVGRKSYLTLRSFSDEVFTSEHDDVAIRTNSQGWYVDVAEPTCGEPDLSVVPMRDDVGLRREIECFWQATRYRKKLLSRVMNEIPQCQV